MANYKLVTKYWIGLFEKHSNLLKKSIKKESRLTYETIPGSSCPCILSNKIIKENNEYVKL